MPSGVEASQTVSPQLVTETQCRRFLHAGSARVSLGTMLTPTSAATVVRQTFSPF